jgi:hypothetical protein
MLHTRRWSLRPTRAPQSIAAPTPGTPAFVLCLASLALILQALDLLSGIRMMLAYGVDLEQNPVARTIFQVGGPIGLTLVKLGVVTTGVVVLVILARVGRTRVARNALIAVSLLGLLGFASNLV